MRWIITLHLTLFLSACDAFVAGTKGGLLRIVVENESEADVTLEVSSTLEVKQAVESPTATYLIQAASTATLLHGFPCRRYGRGSSESLFLFKTNSNFHCSFRATPGCGESPIQLKCKEGDCSFTNAPWPVKCE